MASTSITVHRSVSERSEEVKKQTLQYATFEIFNGEVVVDQTSNNSDWESFINEIPHFKPRFAVCNFHPETEGETRTIFVHWIPPACTIRMRMLYAASRDEVRRSLPAMDGEIYCSDYCDLSYQEVLRRISAEN